MKHCTRCDRTKETSAFTADRQKKDGLRTWCRSCVQEYRRENAQSIAERKKRYEARNVEKTRAQNAAYRAANREQILSQGRAYAKANREKISARLAAYYDRHPEKKWINSYQTRAKKHGLVPVLEDFTKQEVLNRYGDSCFYCADGAFEELDHHVPVAAGGHHTLSNVRPSCARCNNEKSKADKIAVRQFRLANA